MKYISLTEDSAQVLADRGAANHFVGICTGLLPATAAASCGNQKEVLDIAPDIVSVGLHLGLEVDRR